MTYTFSQGGHGGLLVVDFKSWLDAQLKLRHLSARRVAMDAGFSAAHLSRLKNGKVGATPQSVERIADALAGNDSSPGERMRLRLEARMAFANVEIPIAARGEGIEDLISLSDEQYRLIVAPLLAELKKSASTAQR